MSMKYIYFLLSLTPLALFLPTLTHGTSLPHSLAQEDAGLHTPDTKTQEDHGTYFIGCGGFF
ncbi:hypothetical protein EBR66_06690 [bacterium]|nr:hypothetical protein [bacterium]